MEASIIADTSPKTENRIWVQNPKSGRIPGNMAIWVAIYSEMSEFAIMFICIFLAKVHYPQVFAEGIEKVNTIAGMLNTLALLSSSYFVAKAVHSIRKDNVKKAIWWMWFSVASACLYLTIKYWEYHWNIAHGYTIDTDVFFTVYYYITFNHFLHVGWGGGALLWGIYRLKSGAYTSKDHEGLETIASYWHMIDLAWILIFPLLYVLR
ncbi:MAG: cytochrome c oxidase subunit 3 family protein [Pseudomonadota bacterium]